MTEYHCPTCEGTSSQCYRCDNIVGETADGEPIECGADLAEKRVEATESADPMAG